MNDADRETHGLPLVFATDVEIENLTARGPRITVTSVPVDSGALLSWLPSTALERIGVQRWKRWQFQRPEGSVFERWSGPALLHVAGKSTADDVIFAEATDRCFIGARSLAGLSLRFDPVVNRLVYAGPSPAAVAAKLLHRSTAPPLYVRPFTAHARAVNRMLPSRLTGSESWIAKRSVSRRVLSIVAR